MAKCCMCGKRFNVSDARDEYNAEFCGDPDYDEECGGEVCADCAISETHSNMNLGKAIDMVNGNDDYDGGFVKKWL